MGAQAVRLSNVDIDNALKNKDFEVLFQPIFDLGNGALARVETFVRWRHPRLGLLPPGAFISFFESQGRMSELTRYVLGNALNAYMDWRGPWPPGLSVNLALSDLSDEAFTSHFTKLLRDYDFPPDLITLECPMPPVDMPLDAAAAHFDRLANTGARLAIEVRGRANDLLRSLDPFPFDEIKTGGSAILRFARTVRGPGLSAIADLLDVASKANAAITAVGVEDQASLSALRGLGFTAAQGNHLAKVGDLKEFRPQRINEVRELLGLDPLSQESITALFRTEAPSIQTSAPPQEEESETEDALIERLNERMAQFDETPAEAPSADGEATSGPEQNVDTEAAAKTAESEEDKKARAREKAKALALAKRAKARAERKTAAIERAKAKASAKPEDGDAEVAGATAAREMQQRLNKAFKPDEESAAAPNRARAAPDVPAADNSPGTPFLVTRDELAPAAAQPPAPQQAASPRPSTIERAMTAEAGGQLGSLASVSLTVGASGAYFQPGIRVGAAALPGAPDEPIPPAPPLPRHEGAPGEVNDATAAGPVEGPRPPASYGTGETETLGDLHAGTPEADVPLRRPRKRNKNFLMRKYRLMPTHFWPKSWKQAWRRRAAMKAAERSGDRDPGTQPQAAE